MQQPKGLNYVPLYNDASFNGRSLNTSLPVGTVAGSHQVSLTGGATYSIPFALPPGLEGMTPSLGLAYSSQGGNGLLGMGWNLVELSSIQLSGENWYHDGQVSPVSVSSNSENHFVLDGQRLVAVSGAYGGDGTEYRTESESFARIKSWGAAGDGPAWFQVETKNGLIHEYGKTSEAKLNQAGGNTALFWMLERSYDAFGNEIHYLYKKVGKPGLERELVLDEIHYYANSSKEFDPLIKVAFTYENRFDRNQGYIDGSMVGQTQLLTEVSVLTRASAEAPWETERSYQFEFGKDDLYSYLVAVREYGNDGTHFNETIFQYGNASVEHEVITPSNNMVGVEYDPYIVDLDGDGFMDLVQARVAYFNDGSPQFPRYHTELRFYRKSPSGSGFTYWGKVDLDNEFSWVREDLNYPDPHFFNVSDFDGDGRGEIVVEDISRNGTTSFTVNAIHYYGINASGQIDQQTHLVTGSYHRFNSSNVGSNHLLVGDFDGDGRGDWLTTLSDGVNYLSFLSFPAKGDFDQQIKGDFPQVGSPISSADQVLILDFDGDGKTELMLIEEGLTTIYSFSRASNGDILAEEIYTSGYPTQWHHVFVGDFNGDGKSDLFTENGAGLTEIAYATGRDFEASPIILATSIDPSIHEWSGAPHEAVRVADYNGDGKSDLIHIKGDFTDGPYYDNVDLHVYYSNGLSFEHQALGIGGRVKRNWPLYPGDFNGDGGMELMFLDWEDANAIRFLRFRPKDQTRLLYRVADGFNHVTAFSYRYMTETLGGIFYQKGAGSSYPLHDVQLPIPLVEAVTTPDGIGGTRSVSYRYRGAKLHRQGRGWLGFTQVQSLDGLADVQNKQNFAINTDFYLSLPTSSEQRRLSNQQLLSSQTVEYSFIQPGTTSPASPGADRFWLRTNEQETTDHVTGLITRVGFQHDANGNVTSRSTTLNNSSLVRATKYSQYVSEGSWMPHLPEKIEQLFFRFGSNSGSLSQEFTDITYTDEGRVKKTIAFVGEAEEVVTDYQYDSDFGLLEQKTISSPSLPNKDRVTKYRYDSRKRLNRVIEPGVPEVYCGYNVWGKLSWQSVNGNGSGFVYDGFGRIATEIDALQWNTNHSLSFDQSVPGAVFRRNVQVPGGADQRVWYDALGREIATEVQGFQSGQWSRVTRSYDAKGRLATETLPHFAGQAPQTQTYTYDFFDRVTTIDHGSPSAGQTTYSYQDGPNGQRSITVTTPDGQSRTEVIDETGLTVSRTEGGNTLQMSYNARHQLTQVSMGGTALSTMTYDPTYGRQTSLTDADAGTTTYQYNAFGQLVSQTDARGQQITMQYDAAGRITQKSTPEGLTTYSYASSGGGHGQVQAITGPDATVNYSYDSYGRVISQQTQVDGSTYATHYSYDGYGRLHSIDYPSGFGVRRSYNSRGYLTSVKDHTLSETFFQASSVNAFGQYTQYQRGNGKSTVNSYNDYGLPTNTYTAGVQNLSTDFELSSGNLLSRTDLRKGLTESFTYDTQNRLEDYDVSGPGTPTLSVSYSSNGNIAHKTDIGSYSYPLSPPHAVTRVTDPDDLLPTYDQDISYTSNHDPATISEDGYQLEFTYGPEQTQRIKTVLTEPGGGTRTRYYFGDYEKQVSSSGTQHLHYVAGGDGLCAIAVRENGQDSYYYTYTDHLGSLLTLTDDAGQVVAEQNFDPWGRRRNPNSWTYANLPTQPDWLYRGYTGHEGMPEFGLIHMNGRMYDPLLGRMLSPDNYVHPGLGPDGYNRYAYAGNNPLKYVDPSGEVVITAVLVAAAIGGVINLGVQAYQGNINSFQDGAVAFGIGALAGTAGALTGGVAVGAATSAGIVSSTAGGAAIGGIIGGASGGAVGGFVQGVGNAVYFQTGDALKAGAQGALWGAVGGAVIGGTVGYIIGANTPVERALPKGTLLTGDAKISPWTGKIVGVNGSKPGIMYVPSNFGHTGTATDGNRLYSFRQLGSGTKQAPRGWLNRLSTQVSTQKQTRHLAGTAPPGKGYLNDYSDAQAVLRSVHNGQATYLGATSRGHQVFRYTGVTGTNVNVGAGFPSQPTNVFIIKGTVRPSVVPTSPTWTP